MKRSILRALALCLTTVFISGIALAQTASSPSQSGRASTPGSTLQTTPGPNSSLYGGASPSRYLSRAGQPVRLSQLMNTSLRSQTGGSLGQVQDIVLDPTSGQIQFVVLSLDSATGAPGSTSSTTTGIGTTSTSTTPGVSTATTAGGQLVAIPWRLVTSSGQGQFTASVDRNILQSAPTFSNSSWPTMDPAWMQRVYTHFGVNASATGAPGSSTGTGIGTGTGLGNPSTPGLPVTPGTPDITPPKPGASSITTPGTGTGTSGAGTSGSGNGTGAGTSGGAGGK